VEKAEDVYYWGFDMPGQVAVRFGQQVPSGGFGCSEVSELPGDEAIGSITKGPVAGEGLSLVMGEVSLDVASLEFRAGRRHGDRGRPPRPSGRP
jgi:hypothetical protein